MSLWSQNRPQDFWRLRSDVAEDVWTAAVKKAIPLLRMKELDESADIEKILDLTLGEGQFGALHWELSPMKRYYYLFKPFIPRVITRRMRQIYSGGTKKSFQLGWPIEDRFVRFQWEILHQVMLEMGWKEVALDYFWPGRYRFALILTHDIETAAGQAYVRRLAEFEESLGWRSSFNFIPERYPLDVALMNWLREHGFEIGVHGLKHDGKEFFDKGTFLKRVVKINRYMKEFGAAGFRAPLTHRNPEWMQELDIRYDASFFDSDPFEPIPGGVMTIWPYILGHFIELPYTLVQDFSLLNILEAKSAQTWLEKVDFIEDYHGMALINTHPDYLSRPENFQIYSDFLQEMKKRPGVWNVLPAEGAAWWRVRSRIDPLPPGSSFQAANAAIVDDGVKIQI